MENILLASKEMLMIPSPPHLQNRVKRILRLSKRLLLATSKSVTRAIGAKKAIIM